MAARKRAQARFRRGKIEQSDSPWSQDDSKPRSTLGDWQNFSRSQSHSPQVPLSMLSMSQEARNTERHAASWTVTKLRDKGVAFVSAGNLVQDDINRATKKGHEEGEGVEEAVTTAIPAQHTQPRVGAVEQAVPAAAEGGQVARDHGPSTGATSLPPPSIARSPSVSSESTEEILFCGRQTADVTGSRITGRPESAAVHRRHVEKADLDVLASVATTAKTSPEPEGRPRESAPPKNAFLSPARSAGKPARFGRGAWQPRRRTESDEEEEALMNDYIAHLAVDDSSGSDAEAETEAAAAAAAGRGHRDASGHADDASETKAGGKRIQRPPANPPPAQQAIDWDSADLDDLDGLSTTDEEVEEISQVLRQRTRPSGRQYLVTPVGLSTNDARWVSQEKLTSSSAREELRIFAEIRAMEIRETPLDSTADSDDDADGSSSSEELVNSDDDFGARGSRFAPRMTDEQIARALAKQEELGLGSDEVLLFDGQVDGGADGADDDFATGRGYIPFSTKKHLSSRVKSKRNRRQRDHFPSATAFADALDEDPYGAFDIMDFDRPSLRPKKGRKSDFPFDLGVDDPELASHLQSTWSKDREKKAARKREKQEARDMALLDAQERNTPAAIKSEIRRFLVQEVETLELAPMDSATRASVHRLAKALKLKSQSKGKEGQGVGRYPVLTKGPYTPQYTVTTVWEVDALLNTQKFFPRHKAAFRGGAATPRRGGGGGGGGTVAGASYMNGEVVGGSAPELAADNKGRAMLEKMGWTSGMGIGAVGNKGGLEAIKHVVKTTRAGLG